MFKNIRVIELIIEDFINHSQVTFFNVLTDSSVLNEDSKIDISNSRLANMQFFNADFSKFSDLSISNTSMNELELHNVIWPTKISSKSSKHEKENYRQLKSLMSRDGDKVKELEFHAKEMKAHYQSISWYKEPSKIPDKIVLWLNWWSNNYGQYWLLPIGWLFLFVFIMFRLTLAYSPIDYELNKGSFFVFLNPAHKTNFIEGYTLSNASMVIDFFGRVISAFFYFQIVKGFRKFVR